MIEAMIDIETLDTKPSAVVLSIGIVLWGPDGVLDTRALYPSLSEQAALGRTVSEGTVRWWLQQDPTAWERAFVVRAGRMTLEMTRIALFNALKVEPVAAVWANGPAFDLVILENLFGVENVPWKFYEGRDVRTIREEAVLHDWKPKGEFLRHDPVDDCLYQIAVVEEARRRIDLGTVVRRP